MKKPFSHEKLKEDILQKIRNGELKSGDRIFSISELSKKYKISTKSVIKAVEELKANKILFTHQGKGTFVNKTKNSSRSFNNKSIGVITPDLLISFHTEIVVAIEKEAYQKGYYVTVGNVAQDFEKEESYMKDFVNQHFAGAIVITGMNSPSNKYFSEFTKQIPTVIVDIAINGVKTDFVTTDDVSGAYDAVCYLINLGHRRIAFIGGPAGVSTAQQRLEGYKKALIEHNIPINHNLINSTDFNEESGYRVMLEFLKMKQRPTAVFAVSDLSALSAIRAINACGLKTPEDISVVGYGDLRMISDIPLTSVRQPAYQMGKIAIRSLLEKIEGKRDLMEIKEVILPTKLIVRKSTSRCNLSEPVLLNV